MKTAGLCLFLSLFVGFSSQAQMRYWTDVDGNRFEAAYEKEMFDVFYFKTRTGKTVKLPFEKISQIDIDHLKNTLPPKMEIEFLKKGERKKRDPGVPANDVIEIVTGRVTLKKTGALPYDGVLTAEAYLIAKEVNQNVEAYRLFGRKVEKFSFSAENENTHRFEFSAEARKFEIGGTDEGSVPWGCEYHGYVVFVFDAKKNIVAFSSDLPWMKEETAIELRKYRINTFFDEQCKKIPVPRAIWISDNAKWQALF